MAGVQARPEGGSKVTLPRRKRFYVAGPMTGLPQFNFPAFYTAAASLKAAGYDVTSPAELDDIRAQNAALASSDGDLATYEEETGETWGAFLSRDVKLIADEVDAVVLLEGWERSKGARLEAFVARTCGKPVYSYERWLADERPGNPILRCHKVPDEELADVMETEVFSGYNLTERQQVLVDATQKAFEKTVLFGHMHGGTPLGTARTTETEEGVEVEAEITSEEFADTLRGNSGEVRVTSETGGQKGRKPQRTDLLPPEALLALSEVYGMGAEKYDDHNYLKGYDWSLSFGALLRHVLAAENGEWLDEESGLPHVMHAAWHCFTLFMFEKHDLGHDDRISSTVEGVQD